MQVPPGGHAGGILGILEVECRGPHVGELLTRLCGQPFFIPLSRFLLIISGLLPVLGFCFSFFFSIDY